MLVLVGYVLVVASVFGGYTLAGGHLGAMFQPLELLMIGALRAGFFTPLPCIRRKSDAWTTFSFGTAPPP